MSTVEKRGEKERENGAKGKKRENTEERGKRGGDEEEI